MNTAKNLLKKIISSVGLVSARTYNSQQQELEQWRKTIWKPGHYYSPHPDTDKILHGNKREVDTALAGIDLNEASQFALLNEIKSFYQKGNFPEKKQEDFRYYFDNDFFSYSDGIFLHAMIRHFRPSRIIEVGSGYSSALMLDTNERYFQNNIGLEFIEPYPEERLLTLIKEKDNSAVIKSFVQDVPLEKWSTLQKNDILFIDSSHVSKYESDVNFLFFKVLPLLNSGVIIHIHDVFYPFEYPVDWLKEGRAWTEAYLLRAFLQYNNQFEIIMFTSFMEQKHEEWFKSNWPDCLITNKTIVLNGIRKKVETCGQSIYLRKK